MLCEVNPLEELAQAKVGGSSLGAEVSAALGFTSSSPV